MSYNQTFASRSFILAPATPTFLIVTNPNRRFLFLGVNGAAPATFKFGSAPANASDGIALGAASVLGEQGGSLMLGEGDSPTINGGAAPVDSVYAYSTLGTTVNVIEGTVASFG